jgi:DNA-directed RNA polymerase specialized sigma24 family protein
VIVLIYYEGLTLNEVAAMLGLRDKKTPWRRCQRALKRLRDELGAP